MNHFLVFYLASFCITYLLLYNKLPQSLAPSNNKHFLSESFYGSEIWTQLSWVWRSAGHEAAIRVSAQGAVSTEGSPRGGGASKFSYRLIPGLCSSWVIKLRARPFVSYWSEVSLSHFSLHGAAHTCQLASHHADKHSEDEGSHRFP